MRILLSTYGSRGDVEPMVALATRLQDHGAEVQLCAPPDPEFAPLLSRAHVPLTPFSRSWRSWERPPTAEERQQRVADFIAVQYETVAEAAVGCDVIVATAMSQFVGSSIAEQLGVPYRFALFCPDVLDGLDGHGFNELFSEPVNAHRSAIGLPAVDDIGEFMFTSSPLLAADPTLGPWEGSAQFHPIQTGAWILPDERPLSADLLSFLDAGEPPVYVGFGSMRTVDRFDAHAIVEVIRDLGCRVLLGRGWAGLSLVDDRDDCLVIDEVNQQRLFRRLAAVVHHGGAGTTTAAAQAGIPQVVVPQAGDQSYWGDRVALLGIGAVVHQGSSAPVGASMAGAISKALTPEVRREALVVAGAIDPDGAAKAAGLVMDLATFGDPGVA